YRIRHPSAARAAVVLDEYDASAGAQQRDQAREHGLRVAHEVKRVRQEDSVQWGVFHMRETECTRKIRLDGNDARCALRPARQRCHGRGILIDGIQTTARSEQLDERARECALTGAEVGPHAAALSDCAFDECYSLISVH